MIAESFERIHRSNLIGMGVLPLQFTGGVTRNSLKLDGSEMISIGGVAGMKPGAKLTMTIERNGGSTESCNLLSRIDTADELSYPHSFIKYDVFVDFCLVL